MNGALPYDMGHTDIHHLDVQLLIVASLTADGNIWGSTSMLTIAGLYVLQVTLNGVLHVVEYNWAHPITQNIVALAVFVVLSGFLLYLHMRKHLRLVAEALSTGVLEAAKMT